jgi:Kef-type K+ transport system membrane component KefB
VKNGGKASDGAAAQAGSSEAIAACQIILLLVSGRLLGKTMLRIGRPAVIGQLIAGIMLGPSMLGSIGPNGSTRSSGPVASGRQ